MIELPSQPAVWIVTSTDQDLKTHIIAVLASEESAAKLAATLDDADTEGSYSYGSNKMAVLR